MENYTKKEINDILDGYRRIIGIYKKWDFDRIMSKQMQKSTEILEDALSGNECEPDAQLAKKIRKRMSVLGIKTGKINIRVNKCNKRQIIVEARVKSGCEKAEIMTEVIREFFGENIYFSENNKFALTDRFADYVFYENPKFYILDGCAAISRDAGEMSGDSYTFFKTGDSRFVMAISDGMGSGKAAANDSAEVMNFIEEYLEAGFEVNDISEIINMARIAVGNSNPITIDIAMIDLEKAVLCMCKSGGATTFVKSGDRVDIFLPSSLPLGIIEDAEAYVKNVKLKDGDYVIMISDGVADCLPFYDKESQLAHIIADIKSGNPAIMAEKILEECRFYNNGNNQDDMTVLVAGIWETKNLQCKK